MNNPTAFWLISGFLFLWGVAYGGLVIFTVFIATPDHWATLVSEDRIKAEYVVYIGEIPVWAIGMTLIAALTRFFGGVALLMRSSFAFPLYGISFFLVIVIMFRGFVIADVTSVIRQSQVILEFGFILISAYAVWFAHASTRNGTLR